MARIITFSATKGGVGKTTLSYHFGYYLAKELKQRVLMIDLDEQRTLSIMMHMPKEKQQASNIFKVFQSDALEGDVENTGITPQKVNVDDDIELYGLNADDKLEDVDKLMSVYGSNNNTSLDGYLNLNGYKNDFDYIIIDTHPEMRTAVVNAYVASDVIYTPIEPTRYGINTISNMKRKLANKRKKTVDTKRKSLIDARLYWIGNLIKFNTKLSQSFLKNFQGNNDFVAFMHMHECFNRATAGSSYVLDYLRNLSSKSQSDKNTYREISQIFKKMADTADNPEK